MRPSEPDGDSPGHSHVADALAAPAEGHDPTGDLCATVPAELLHRDTSRVGGGPAPGDAGPQRRPAVAGRHRIPPVQQELAHRSPTAA